MNYLVESLPVVLRDMRIENGIGQAELAKRLGVSVQLVSAHECGRNAQNIKFAHVIGYLLACKSTLAELEVRLMTVAGSMKRFEEQRRRGVGR